MLKALFAAVSVVATLLSPASSQAQTRASERGLIVFLNMYTGDKGFWMDEWYKTETASALVSITLITGGAYGSRKFLVRNQAKVSSLLQAVREMNADPKIKAIDLLVYTHGRPNELNVIYEGLGMLQPLTTWVPLREIAEPIARLGSKKLRAVFADACFSATHNDEWLAAGFKAASGTIGIDCNQSRDVDLFLSRWVRGRSFAAAVSAANAEPTAPLLDRSYDDGNSRKAFQGQAGLTIDSPTY